MHEVESIHDSGAHTHKVHDYLYFTYLLSAVRWCIRVVLKNISLSLGSSARTYGVQFRNVHSGSQSQHGVCVCVCASACDGGRRKVNTLGATSRHQFGRARARVHVQIYYIDSDACVRSARGTYANECACMHACMGAYT